MAIKNQIHSTTQQFLDIYDVTNDFVIMSDGAVALVLTVSAMNFGLLSEDEQDATIYTYAALLNSLSFPIQIVIRSQPKDVTNYLKLIQQKEEETVNPTFRLRIREYRTFVESLVQEQNVLDKKFYIAIPLSAVEMGLTTKSVVPGAKNAPLSSFDKSYIIEKARTNLIPRRDHVVDQLARIGLYSRQLTTQDLIQLLYSSYNPESFEGQKVTDTQNYTTPLIQAQILGDPHMIDPNISTPQPIVENTPPASTPQNMVTEQPSLVTTPPTQTSPVAETPTMTTPPVAQPVAETPVVTPPVSPSVVPTESPNMTSTPTETPVTTATPVPPVSSVAPQATTSTPTMVTPEVPTMSTPPMTNTQPSPTQSDAADPQALINQTLSQLGTTTPVSPVQTNSVPEI